MALATAARDAAADGEAFDVQRKSEALPREQFPWRSSHVLLLRQAAAPLSTLRSPPFVQKKRDS